MHSLRDEPAVRFVVVIEGPPPAAAIRSRLAELVKKRQWPVALISASVVDLFTPTQTREAFDYLMCSAQEASACGIALRRLVRADS